MGWRTMLLVAAQPGAPADRSGACPEQAPVQPVLSRSAALVAASWVTRWAPTRPWLILLAGILAWLLVIERRKRSMEMEIDVDRKPGIRFVPERSRPPRQAPGSRHPAAQEPRALVVSRGGLPVDGEPSELMRIAGIDGLIVQRLRTLGIVNLSDLASLDDDGEMMLAETLGGHAWRIEQHGWVAEARRLLATPPESPSLAVELLEAPAAPFADPGDSDVTGADAVVIDLRAGRDALERARPTPVTVLPGIGPRLAQRLAELGIATVHDLAALDAEGAGRLGSELGSQGWRVERDGWVEQARLVIAETDPATTAGPPAARR
jgi:predicted flap endonuclease-1-like 5' DNA nuclease